MNFPYTVKCIREVYSINRINFFIRQVVIGNNSIYKLIILFLFLLAASVWTYTSTVLRKGKVKPMTEFLFTSMDILVQCGINLCAGLLPLA